MNRFAVLSLMLGALGIGGCAAGASPQSPNDSISRLSNEMKAPAPAGAPQPQINDLDLRIAMAEAERRRSAEDLAAAQQPIVDTSLQEARISELERQLTARDQDLARARIG